MKYFKSFDFFTQLGLLIFSIIAFILSSSISFNPGFFIIAFGILQFISIIVHAIAGYYPWKMTKWRKIHHIGMLLVFGLLLIAIFQDSGHSNDKEDKYSMRGLEILIFTSIPAILLSLFYFIITWREWINMKKFA